MTNAIGIALTGLNSASLRLNASASNIANISTSGSLTDPDNAPYTPLTTQSTALGSIGGVHTAFIAQQPAFTPSYDPDSPFADENGIIGVPNVNLAEELVNIKLAAISYKANLSTIKVAGELFDELLETFKD
ncbi:MAG: flagellar biosynthesis protein FlgC [Zetaproteobacteria bacterium]|nr:MAG: flagellar biosynthesis protein FlgC [Zetaproteobacteria bacterium]